MTVEPLTLLLALVVLVEPFFVLWLAPRLTTDRVEARAREVLRDELGIPEPAEGEPRLTLLAALPNALKVPAPTSEDVAAAQRQQAAFIGSLVDALRPALKAEVEAAMNLLEVAAPAPEDAARALQERSLQSRYSFAAREELFRAAVEKHAGAAGLLALEALPPKVYRAYANQGGQGAAALAKEAGAIGIKLPGFAAAANAPQDPTQGVPLL